MEDRPTADEVLLIGTVIDAFGLRGEIKVRSVTDRVDHLRRHVRTILSAKSAVLFRYSASTSQRRAC